MLQGADKETENQLKKPAQVEARKQQPPDTQYIHTSISLQIARGRTPDVLIP